MLCLWSDAFDAAQLRIAQRESLRSAVHKAAASPSGSLISFSPHSHINARHLSPASLVVDRESSPPIACYISALLESTMPAGTKAQVHATGPSDRRSFMFGRHSKPPKAASAAPGLAESPARSAAGIVKITSHEDAVRGRHREQRSSGSLTATR